MLIFEKIDPHFVLHIIFVISVTIISQNLHNQLQSVSVIHINYQVHRTPPRDNTSLRLNRLGHLPLSEKITSHNTYYSIYDAAKIFDEADRPSPLRSLGRPYAPSYDEYSVAFVCYTIVIH